MRSVDTAWPGRCNNSASMRRCCGPRSRRPRLDADLNRAQHAVSHANPLRFNYATFCMSRVCRTSTVGSAPVRRGPDHGSLYTDCIPSGCRLLSRCVTPSSSSSSLRKCAAARPAGDNEEASRCARHSDQRDAQFGAHAAHRGSRCDGQHRDDRRCRRTRSRTSYATRSRRRGAGASPGADSALTRTSNCSTTPSADLVVRLNGTSARARRSRAPSTSSPPPTAS